MMLKKEKAAKKPINRDIAKGAAKETAKKAGKDALKTMAVSALFDLLKSVMNGLVRFLREKQKSFKVFLKDMRKSIEQFIKHIANIVRGGVSTVIGTVVNEIFGPIVSMFKKLASFIRQGISSLTEAVHYLIAKENRDKPISIKIAQVGKIVVAGLTAAGAIIGGELIETALSKIPFMKIEIPLLGSIANITGMFLASLLSGIVGAIVINRIDHYIANKQRNENLEQQIDKKNEIIRTQQALIDVETQNVIHIKERSAFSIAERRQQAKEALSEAMTTIFHDEESDNSGLLAQTADELASVLD